MSTQTVYFVTGANRGIGLGLVSALAARSNTLVFAGARDLSNVAALEALSAKHPGQVEIVQLTSTDVASNQAAAAAIERKTGHLDVVIANAGISSQYGPAALVSLEDMRSHWEVNTLGPLVLFQAVLPLLNKATSPTFTVISSAAASIGNYSHLGATAYGSSKAAVNFIVKVLHFENEKIVVNAISPGWVATDMGNVGASAIGMPSAPVSIEDSVNGILRHFDGATRETKGGKFLNAVIASGNPWDRDTEELTW